MKSPQADSHTIKSNNELSKNVVPEITLTSWWTPLAPGDPKKCVHFPPAPLFKECLTALGRSLK